MKISRDKVLTRNSVANPSMLLVQVIKKWLGNETLILEAVAVVTIIISLLIKVVLICGHCCLMRTLGQVQQSESPGWALKHQTNHSYTLTSPDLPSRFPTPTHHHPPHP